jgi:hypothetical protein
MLATLNALVVLASESHGIPGSHPWAKLAVPIGFVLFIGSVYMLVRSNLGTKRGYLVTATSLFGFLIIYGSFWAFGAPGTPPATGPQNLPGQELDAYEDVWRPFAGDSTIANDPAYDVAKTHPEGFAKAPQDAGLEPGFEATANDGAGEVQTFFSTEEGPLTDAPVEATWEEVPETRSYAKADNGRPIIAVTLQQTYQVAQAAPGQPAREGPPKLTPDGAKAADDESNVAPEGVEIGDLVEDGETFTAFAYFDAGNPMFPSLLLLGAVLLLFTIHALLLARDEQRERREREAAVVETAAPERETVGASPAP